MSIHDLRKVPELKGITMRYEEGGKVQVYKVGDKEVRLRSMVRPADVIAAFKEME